MSRRWERRSARPDIDLETVESPPPARVVEEDRSEFDLDAMPFEPRAGEPVDPVAASPALRTEDPLREFSDSARKRYDLEVSTFAADLRRQSLAHRRAQGGDSVSGRHVTSAASLLRSHHAKGLFGYVGAVGGLLIGLGVQSLGSMMEKGVYTSGGVLWSAGTTAAGVTAFMWQVTRDRS